MNNNILRVRTIIPSLEYGKLKKSGTLPNITFFMEVPKLGGKFPKCANKHSPSDFGVVIDQLIRLILINQDFKVELLDDIFDYQELVNDLKKELDYLEYLKTFVLEKVLPLITSGTNFDFDKELNYKNISGHPEMIISGHPDLIIGDTIYDIKTTGRFGRMRIDTILQLLAYYTLAKEIKIDIKNIGLILPAQNLVISKPINFNTDKFLEVLSNTSNEKLTTTSISTDDYLQFQSIQFNVGTHVSREKTLFSISKFPMKNLQIFLGSNINGNHNFTDDDISKTLNHILTKEINLFVHAPYSVNLCKIFEDNFVVKMLKKQLETTIAIAGKGVVVHIGNKCEMEYQVAYDNMMKNVILIAESATEECPLLIETDSGGSILDNPKELEEFILKLPDTLRKKVAICLDTCHVFAAGYQPMEAINFIKNVPIKLIHYNDSKYSLGTKKDRHARIGTGMIGFKKLLEVGVYATNKKIPLVIE